MFDQIDKRQADLQRDHDLVVRADPGPRPQPTGSGLARLQRIIGNQGLERSMSPGGKEAAHDSLPGHSVSHAETPRGGVTEEQGDVAFADDAGAPAAPAPAPTAPAPATPTASLAFTGDTTYDDQPTYSHKNIKFNATWSGGVKEDYIIVNWLKGSIKKPDGTPYKVSMYGSLVDFNFGAFQVDSIDEDPAYWSAGGVRWNYNVDAANKFSATDSPGPPSFAAGTKAHVDFKTAVYKSADVPNKTTGSIAATPLSSFQTWNYNMEVNADGTYKH